MVRLVLSAEATTSLQGRFLPPSASMEWIAKTLQTEGYSAAAETLHTATARLAEQNGYRVLGQKRQAINLGIVAGISTLEQSIELPSGQRSPLKDYLQDRYRVPGIADAATEAAARPNRHPELDMVLDAMDNYFAGVVFDEDERVPCNVLAQHSLRLSVSTFDAVANDLLERGYTPQQIGVPVVPVSEAA